RRRTRRKGARAPRPGRQSSCRRKGSSPVVSGPLVPAYPAYNCALMWTVAQLSRDLAAGRTTSRQLVEQALARIAAPSGEGARAFLKVYDEQARADADHADQLRKRGVRRSPIDGLPVSLKDLFNVAGDVTRAGPKVLAREPDATLARMEVKGLRLLLPRSSALAELDRAVEQAFERGLKRFAEQGAIIEEQPVPAFDRQAEYFKGGGYAGAESYHIHRP